MNLKTFLCTLAVVGTTLISASAHCQIPCGIYDDPARFKALAEHIVAEANKIGKVKSAVDTAVKNLKGAMPWTDWAVMGFTGWLQKRFTILILMSMHDRHLCLVLTTLHI